MSSFPALLKDSSNIPISSAYIPNGNFVALQASTNTNTDASGNTSAPALLSLAASNSTSGTLQTSQTGNSNGTALSVLGYATVAFTVNMSGFTGTVNFEISEDGTNYDPVYVTQSGTTTTATTVVGSTTTSIHDYVADCAGFQSVRARTSGTSAGNVTVTAHALPINLAPRVVNSVLYGTNVTAGDTAIAVNGSGVVKIVAQASAGTNIGNVGMAPQTSGGTSDYHVISAASTNAANIKASAGQVFGYDIYNSNAAARYVKLYNTSSAPTAGSGTPLRTIGVAPNSRASFHSTVGIAFSSGIGITTVTGIADSDTNAVGASDLAIEIDYK